MAVFGVLIYEVDKCATAKSPANIIAAKRQIDVARSYALTKEDSNSVLVATPLKSIEDAAEIIEQKGKQEEEKKCNTDEWAKSVASMKTVSDLRCVVATLVAAAKSPGVARNMGAKIAILWESLGPYDWGNTAGTYFRVAQLSLFLIGSLTSIEKIFR